jgi:hypothetical protein
MAAMIAGMSGVGTGKGRARPWGLLRSGAIALLTALGVVLVASRVNRPRVPVERGREAVLEETLAEVELDTRTLRTTVDSLAKRTRARFVIEPGLSQAIEGEEAAAGRSPDGAPVLQRFRDVRLGALLSRVADQWGSRMPLGWRVEGETITLYLVQAQTVVERRLYSLRKLTEDRRQWRALTKSWLPPPMPVPRGGGRGGRGGGGGGLFGSGSIQQTEEQLLMGELLSAFRRHFDQGDRWQTYTIQTWAGWMLIEAPPEMHEQFERFLAMIGESAIERGGR